MNQESGRSLMEIIGIMAIGAIMTAGSVATYNMIRNNQVRTIASADLTTLVRDIRLLFGARGDYNGLNIDYLIKAGALKSDKSPIGGDWSVWPSVDGKRFEITLTDLSMGECDYFISASPTWAAEVRINGAVADNTADSCFSTHTNKIVFIVE